MDPSREALLDLDAPRHAAEPEAEGRGGLAGPVGDGALAGVRRACVPGGRGSGDARVRALRVCARWRGEKDQPGRVR